MYFLAYQALTYPIYPRKIGTEGVRLSAMDSVRWESTTPKKSTNKCHTHMMCPAQSTLEEAMPFTEAVM